MASTVKGDAQSTEASEPPGAKTFTGFPAGAALCVSLCVMPKVWHGGVVILFVFLLLRDKKVEVVMTREKVRLSFAQC